MKLNSVIYGNCLEVMVGLPDRSIGMILADLPYGVTNCAWDSVIPFEPMWAQFKRLIQPKRAIVLTATQPFTTDLIVSNREWFKYCWVWNKGKPGNFLTGQVMPLMCTEDVLIFSSGNIANESKSSMAYHPQMEERDQPRVSKVYKVSELYDHPSLHSFEGRILTHKYPKNIINIPNTFQCDKFHPTQKPIALFEYLIRTYTNPGDVVLDPTAGSMTTAIACLQTGRQYVCIEQDADYYRKGCDRVQAWLDAPKQVSLLSEWEERQQQPKPEQLSLDEAI